MSVRNDPYQEAREHVIKFLIETGLPWSSFEQTFDTLQNVLVTVESAANAKSRLTALVKNVHECFLKTRNERKGAWEKFYRKVFVQLDVDSKLPEGVHWIKTGKNDWRMIKDLTHGDVLGKLISNTERVKGMSHWKCEDGHPLLTKKLLLSDEAAKLPKSCRRIHTALVSAISNATYVVTFELHVPIRNVNQGREHMLLNYIDNKKAETAVRKLLPRPLVSGIESTRDKRVRTDGMEYNEKLSLILRT